MPEWTYEKAGLNLDTYEKTLEGIAPLMRRTHDRLHVLDGFGGFASLFMLDYDRFLFSRKYRKPVIITCTDGVGSKLKIASLTKKYDTVGIDLVAMSVNDCLCTGGEPLVFLDYLAMPKDDPELTRQLMEGMVEGCLQAECSLTGGETAILPEFYQPEDFDMAGFCVGVVEKDSIIDGKAVQVGDTVIGLASTGIHSNGYSLVRKIVFEHAKLTVNDRIEELGKTVGEELLTPTRIYVKAVKSVIQHYPFKKKVVRGLAHITGGGLVDNVPRVLPPGRRVEIQRGSWPVPPVFHWLQKLGEIPQPEVDRVFNQGIGFVMIVAPHFANSIIHQLADKKVPSYIIGKVKAGDPGVDMV
ncbi:phosphoribosylformylglycinamidine cyclo-ligase [Telmatocola sphagniphila]|uniref:Phosphoribosylformylglycinamidine cyclo-ligase n=1 Tax=Telmatocola sphagniphila TaxID=1123043 RepID=A0A8E6B7P6_9BACT|nr:phosphoribosylformylglycinamidine cyclo-ligase [Telmatocola sphagniphila]QVL33645.1 phosphoribosylformylglycinamidine cyclo-ligase [Telmatocola sphagniphila]